MVLYQAFDDNLRIVYHSVIRQLRFLQLRDKDAVILLNTRDYELIKCTFDKYPSKVSLKSLGINLDPNMMCHNYRKYNQAYFEQILINYEVEDRVAANFREKFLVTANDIMTVFEMYCKEDYDQYFLLTDKSMINHSQFIYLFEICIKYDSFKVAMLIYTCHIDPAFDFDSNIMETVLASIKNSTRFHEIKLFLIHQHFECMELEQLHRIVSIYLLALKPKEYQKHPVINLFNTVKVSLLICQICWKIKAMGIYTLMN